MDIDSPCHAPIRQYHDWHPSEVGMGPAPDCSMRLRAEYPWWNWTWAPLPETGWLDNGETPSGKPMHSKSLGGGNCHQQSAGFSQANIFTRQDDEAAQDEAGIFASVEHFGQPVEGGIGV